MVAGSRPNQLNQCEMNWWPPMDVTRRLHPLDVCHHFMDTMIIALIMTCLIGARWACFEALLAHLVVIVDSMTESRVNVRFAICFGPLEFAMKTAERRKRIADDR